MQDLFYRLKQSISRARRHKQRQSTFLLLEFHPGEEASELHERLSTLVRCEDSLFVHDSSHLALIAEDLSHVSDPMRISSRLMQAAGESGRAAAIVTGLGAFHSPEAVVREAEETLKKAVENGLEALYSNLEAGAESSARLQLERELELDVGAAKLATYYQPIYNLAKGTLAGFEALVRWDHPQRGVLLPGEFLEIAELKGFLLKIDEIVLQQALSQIPIWNKDSEYPIYVSANLASAHFLNADNLKTLIATLNSHPDSLNYLRIDVSEQVLFEKRGIESLETLDMLRIGFNLDDFGVDSESFHCLGSFPFNSLKIDRTLIGQMEDEVNAELIVAVLRIAKRMGMKTIAEGVVTHAQLEELRNLGCTEAQGFLFSEAVTVSKASELINTEYRW